MPWVLKQYDDRMSTYSRRGIHGQVVDSLGLRILSGSLPPGSVIDPEQLIEEFEVSRTVVREAFKVLTAKGLLDARPRTGTYITERSRWQLLDTDVMNWRSRGASDPLLLLELGEVRQIIEPAAARMAAARRTAAHITELRAALDAMIAWDGVRNDDLVQADLAFHRLVLIAAGNELLQHFEVVLQPALEARDTLLHDRSGDRSFIDSHTKVFEAINNRDSQGAHELMSQMMATAAHDIELVLERDARGRDILRGRSSVL